MKRSIKDLAGYIVKTKDGKEGKVKDFLFDEKQWVIRYVHVDFGTLFSSEKVLIPRNFLKQPLAEENIFPAELTTSEIEKCPKIQDHMPVSREYEKELHKHLNISPYWATSPMGMVGAYPPRPILIPSKTVTEDEVESILRSFEEIKGYQIHAIDGTIGRIEDIIIDDADWQTIYAATDTKNWLSSGKKVLIAVNWMDKISYEKGEVSIKVRTDTIEKAPEYNPETLMDKKYEENLFDFFSRSLVK